MKIDFNNHFCGIGDNCNVVDCINLATHGIAYQDNNILKDMKLCTPHAQSIKSSNPSFLLYCYMNTVELYLGNNDNNLIRVPVPIYLN